MKKFMIFILSLLSFHYVFPKKVIPLPEIMRPIQITVAHQRVYISDRAAIALYSVQDGALIKKLGRSGEGPGEFRIFAIVYPLNDTLLINSAGKLSHFKTDGTYIKEKKLPSETALMLPLGKNFAARGFRVSTGQDEKISYKTINLYDPDFEKIKEIFKQKLDWQQGKGTRILHVSFSYTTYEDRLYVAGQNDFIIEIFDDRGNPVKTIKQTYQNRKFTDQDKEKILDRAKRTRSAEAFEQIKNNAIFPDVYPAIEIIQVTDDLIYVKTYKRKKNLNEFFVFDLKGKRIQTLYLPSPESPFVIKDKKLYQLIENLDNEIWELHITSIEPQ